MSEAFKAAELFGGEVIGPDKGEKPLTDTEKKAIIQECRDILSKGGGLKSVNEVLQASPVIGKIEPARLARDPIMGEFIKREVRNMDKEWTAQISLKIGGHMINIRDVKDEDLIKRTGEMIEKINAALPYIANLEKTYMESKIEETLPGVDNMDGEPDLDEPNFDNMKCEKCGGEMWDNRRDKRNPKAPDFKCKDKECNMVCWVRGGKVSWEKGLPARGRR